MKQDQNTKNGLDTPQDMVCEPHTDALLEDGGEASVTTGADLIAAYNAACP